MKKFYHLFLSLLSLKVFALFPTSQIQEFQGSFNGTSGQARATRFIYDTYDFGTQPRFSVFKQASNLVFRANGEEFVWQSAPEAINELTNLSWSGMNLYTSNNNSTLNFNVSSFNGSSQKSQIRVSNLKIDCDYKGSRTDLLEKLLDSCFNKRGKVFIGNASFNATQTQSLNSLNIFTRNQSLSFSLRESGVWIRGQGAVNYQPSTNQIVIRVDRVTAAGINAYNRFFNEIQSLEGEKVQISRPYIRISL